LVVVLAAMTVRTDLAGVSSLGRSHGRRPRCYHRLLYFFHSPALHLPTLLRTWTALVARLFARRLVRVGERVVLLADGLKAPKEGKKMPAVKSLHQDVRIIAATNRDLTTAVAEGKFRRDLHHRLNVSPISVPPLRERAAGVPLLETFFLQRFARKLNKLVKRVPEAAMRRLAGYAWPGNIRELQKRYRARHPAVARGNPRTEA
jgi:hypothetical protein